MRKRLITIVAALGLLGGLAVGGAAIASATGGSKEQASGPEADKARAAALAHVGGGTAGSVERDSEDGAAWEVEVTRPDGTTVDVLLGADYRVLAVESESEQAGEPDDAIEDENGADDHE